MSRTASLALSNQRIGYQVKEKIKILLHLRCDELRPEDIQLLPRRFLEQLSLLNPSYTFVTKKEKKTLLHLRCDEFSPKDIQLLPRRFLEQLI